MNIPLDAPIYMAPLSGVMFLAGVIAHQVAGMALDDNGFRAWGVLSLLGLVLQVGAFVILINL